VWRDRKRRGQRCLAEGRIERENIGSGKNMTRIEGRQKIMKWNTSADPPDDRGDAGGSRAAEGSWNP
jgi:hypothetical protein